jgi:hypothetical protein
VVGRAVVPVGAASGASVILPSVHAPKPQSEPGIGGDTGASVIPPVQAPKPQTGARVGKGAGSRDGLGDGRVLTAGSSNVCGLSMVGGPGLHTRPEGLGAGLGEGLGEGWREGMDEFDGRGRLGTV